MVFTYENQVTRHLLTQYGFGLYLERPESVVGNAITDQRLASAQYTEDQFKGAWARLAFIDYDIAAIPPAWNNLVIPVIGYDSIRGEVVVGQPIPPGNGAMALEVWQRANPIDIRRRIYDALLEHVRVPVILPLYDVMVRYQRLESYNTEVASAAQQAVYLPSYTAVPVNWLGQHTIGPSPDRAVFNAMSLQLRPMEEAIIGIDVITAEASEFTVALWDVDSASVIAEAVEPGVHGFHEVVLRNSGEQARVTVAVRAVDGSVTVDLVGMRSAVSVTGQLPPACWHADAVNGVGVIRGPVYGSTVYEKGPFTSDLDWAVSYGGLEVRFKRPPRRIPWVRVNVPPFMYGSYPEFSSMNSDVYGYEAPLHIVSAATAISLLRRVELDYADVQGYSAWLQSAKQYADRQLAAWNRNLLMHERAQTRIDHGNFVAPLGGYVDTYVL